MPDRPDPTDGAASPPRGATQRPTPPETPTDAGGQRTADVAIGRIGPARGVRGDVFVEPWTDDPDVRFAAGAALRTEPAERGPLVVGASSTAGGKLVVHFDGVNDRSAAGELRGVRLVIAATERPPLESPDEFYASDLVGIAASTVDGAELGPVRDVVEIAGADYLVVEVEGRERLVPFVAAMVPTVDLPGGRVVIDPPEGLFDL
jgi:16S rRNA processing protein RimM